MTVKKLADLLTKWSKFTPDAKVLVYDQEYDTPEMITGLLYDPKENTVTLKTDEV